MLIKPIPSIHILLGLAAAAGLVACADPAGGQAHGQHHAGKSVDMMGPAMSGASPAQGGMMSGGMTRSEGGCAMMGDGRSVGPGCMQQADKQAMCAMYRAMRDAPNEQARQAMMDRNMQAMSPEMRQRHMEMMRQQCE